MSTSCFICHTDYPHEEINAHEKSCLDSITANDVQYTRSQSEEDNLPKKDFKTCQLCGKIYSHNSMRIHVKNCEELRLKQATVGTTPNFEINYTSLSEISVGKTCCQRSPRTPTLSPTTTTTHPIIYPVSPCAGHSKTSSCGMRSPVKHNHSTCTSPKSPSTNGGTARRTREPSGNPKLHGLLGLSPRPLSAGIPSTNYNEKGEGVKSKGNQNAFQF